MSRHRVDRRKLNALLDAASDAAMATSDAEILAEARLEYAAHDARIDDLRNMVNERIVIAKKQRLIAARQKIDAASVGKTMVTSVVGKMSEMRARAAELLASVAAPETKMTVAFRNGEEMSEPDMASLIEDLEILVTMQRKES